MKSKNKTELANAYGIGTDVLNKEIERHIPSMTKEEKRILGDWKKKGYFLPNRLEIIYKYLGKPEE